MENFGAEIVHLLSFLESKAFITIGGVEVTNYAFFLAIGVIVVVTMLFWAKRGIGIVPKTKLYNVVEAIADFVRTDLAGANIGADGKRYFPFLATVFMFILLNNLIGVIPSGKPATGTMGVTVALALVTFVVFNAAGMRKFGVGGYVKGVVPHGVPGLLWPVIWIIEVLSLLIRPFTLSIRLFANMYAGHIVLGIFSILTSIAVEQLLHGVQSGAIGDIAIGGIAAIAWMVLLTALYVLEIVVAVLQAYIFTLLSTVYISLAVHEH